MAASDGTSGPGAKAAQSAVLEGDGLPVEPA